MDSLWRARLRVAWILTSASLTFLAAQELGRLPRDDAGDRMTDDSIMSTIRQLTVTLNKCGVDTRHMSQMRRIMLAGDGKCMDGTPAGYYIRKSPGSKKWLVFLEGGSYCFDKTTCNTRISNSPNLTSSSRWPPMKEGQGILSGDAEDNPFLFFANVVYVPYCSGDVWAGTTSKGSHLFMGSVIVEEVMVDLLNHGLRDANKLFLSGSSAGATGVLLNIDKVTALLAERAPGVNVLGIVDSGWFVDVPPFQKMRCTGMLHCAPVESIKRGSRYWKARVPSACEQEYHTEPWKCFFGYRLYPFIKTPVFIIQYLYDAAQIGSNMGYNSMPLAELGSREQKERDQYMQHLSLKMNRTLQGVAAVFAPSCFSHEILTKNYWYKVAIRGVSLYDALKCWEESQQATNRVRPSSSDSSSGRIPAADRKTVLNRSVSSSDSNGSGGTAAAAASSVSRNGTTRHPNSKSSRRHHRMSISGSSNSVGGNTRQPRNARQAEGSAVVRDMAASLRMTGTGESDWSESDIEMQTLTNQLIEYRQQKQAQCTYRVLDSCDSAYCNFKCPNYLALFGGGSGTLPTSGGNGDASASASQNSASSSRDFFTNNR